MLFFIHIPKTAGTSVYNALQQMAPGRVAWYSGPNHTLPQFLSTPVARNSTLIYGGHFGYKQIRGFINSGDKIYSVIREPVERAFSTYNHVLMRDPQHPLHSEIRDLSITEAAKSSPLFHMEISNRQCFYLSGTTNFTETKNIVVTEEFNLYTMSQINLLIHDMAIECGINESPVVGSHNVAENDYMAQATSEEKEFVSRLNEEDCKLFSYFGSM